MQVVKNIIPQKLKNIYHFTKAFISVIYFRYPARQLKVIAVTGTDGKTTTATMIHHVLSSSQRKVGLISTVSAKIGKREVDIGLHVTSPDPIKLQRLLREAVDKGYTYMVLEVTSHGIDQHRVLGTNISYAVLTNITSEHLDYHGTYEHYLRTKMKILNSAKTAIINKKDKSYKKVVKLINKKIKIVQYDDKSMNSKIRKEIFERFPEDFNRMNCIACYMLCRELGVSDNEFIHNIRTFPGVLGRMDKIDNKKGIKVYIDFAHTPNALENVLTLLKKKNRKGKLVVVFGCAGERDIQKRRVMGKISSKLADISIYTAEDPRYEKVENIIGEIVEGALRTGAKEIKVKDRVSVNKKRRGLRGFIRIPERGEAISFAINSIARKDDTVVICGKGHEKSMAYNGIEYPWSDHEAVKMALEGKVKKIVR